MSNGQRTLAPLGEAAAIWRVHPRTLRRRIADGTVAGYRVPGSRAIRVDLNELEDLLDPIPTAAMS